MSPPADRAMPSLERRLFDEIARIPLLDPHSHIDPRAPTARGLSDLLGYHYYTELAHSAGLPKERIETTSGLAQAQWIVRQLADCSNTVQYSWLIELAQTFFGFSAEHLTLDNLPDLYQAAAGRTAAAGWEDEVCRLTGLEGIFLTNDFDDPLEGFDTRRYIPCLRTDDLVFHLGQEKVRERLASATGTSPTDWKSLGRGLDRLFEHFVGKGARAGAVSLPPDFEPRRPGDAQTEQALQHVLAGSASADDRRTLSYAVFYALADRCEEYRLPFDLMIGVRRNVYEGGVHQGRDLFERTTSLYQYRHLFNEKVKVTFPISVLASGQNQELVAYSWIFPNVVTSGHWWYSNVPVYIESDLRARLEAVPRSKQIGYYSDAYKLEFVLPKFNMYRRCLARVLARDFVVGRGTSEEQAVALARTILRENVERIFPARAR